jgi:hypothetical protein
LTKRVPADAPGCSAAGPGVADDATGRVLPGRKLHVTADSAYAGEELKQLPDGVTWTTRLRANAALHDLPPARTGRKGRLRLKGGRLPSLAKIAAGAAFSQVTVTRYGKTETIAVSAFACLWYSVSGTTPVTVILIRDTADMTAKLRRVIIAAKFKRVHADQPEPAEIHAIRWPGNTPKTPPPKTAKVE